MNKAKMIILSLLVFISSCRCTKSPNEPRSIRELTSIEKTIVESDNRFGIKLFQEIVKAQKDTNIFISPLSVSMALGMTLNGAAGTTREAMIRTLELEGLSDQQINENYQSLIELLVGLDPKVKFQIANSIWHRDDMTFEQSFIDLNKKYFDALVSALNFGDPNAKNIINAWVYEHTNGKINKIVEKINRDDVMFLINAIYFKGIWKYQFEEKNTADALFTLPDNSQVPCKMMAQTGEFQHFANDQFQAIDLPYGDELFSMVVILPSASADIDELISELDQNDWNHWLASFQKEKGTIFLPRFKLEYKLRMNDVLIALGMGVAFSPGADFTRMFKPGGLFISEVNHKTFIEVNEEGTEAAAVTSVVIGRTSTSGFVMRVDRPFIFAIRENHSGTILFVGKIVNPS
ncbi:MAG: serpin family protein [candidate division KSB1 bacterium]|nr:serpin family protein [candidate division KSB1 bacterium]